MEPVSKILNSSHNTTCLAFSFLADTLNLSRVGWLLYYLLYTFGLNDTENFEISKTYMYFGQISYIGKITQRSGIFVYDWLKLFGLGIYPYNLFLFLLFQLTWNVTSPIKSNPISLSGHLLNLCSNRELFFIKILLSFPFG